MESILIGNSKDKYILCMLYKYIKLHLAIVYNWLASEASKMLSGVYKFKLVRCI